jgi:hypothetical protein
MNVGYEVQEAAMKALVEMQLVKAMYREREDEGRRRARDRAPLSLGEHVVIRRAGRRDARRLERLAQLDCARVPAGPTLVAELDGELVAALPLDERGAPMADPFVPSAPFVAMLELRRTQLRAVV